MVDWLSMLSSRLNYWRRLLWNSLTVWEFYIAFGSVDVCTDCAYIVTHAGLSLSLSLYLWYIGLEQSHKVTSAKRGFLVHSSAQNVQFQVDLCITILQLNCRFCVNGNMLFRSMRMHQQSFRRKKCKCKKVTNFCSQRKKNNHSVGLCSRRRCHGYGQYDQGHNTFRCARSLMDSVTALLAHMCCSRKPKFCNFFGEISTYSRDLFSFSYHCFPLTLPFLLAIRHICRNIMSTLYVFSYRKSFKCIKICFSHFLLCWRPWCIDPGVYAGPALLSFPLHVGQWP